MARSGLKLKAVPCAPASLYIMTNGIRGNAMTLTSLASMLASPLSKPVKDETKQDACYNVDLKFAPESSEDSALPSVFTALNEQLGLQLKPQTVPVEGLVIDHLDTTPTDN